jgi:hypothetical protein
VSFYSKNEGPAAPQNLNPEHPPTELTNESNDQNHAITTHDRKFANTRSSTTRTQNKTTRNNCTIRNTKINNMTRSQPKIIP